MKRLLILLFATLCIHIQAFAADPFTVSVQQITTDSYGLTFPGQTDSYYQVCTAENLTSTWTVVDMGLNQDAPMLWTNDIPLETRRYYRLRQVSLTNALDTDADGMDDPFELAWHFLDPLSNTDAQQDYDNDGLYNYGEFVYNTSPADKDSDKDWAIDGYEVYMGTHPANAQNTPTLEFRINGSALYTTDTNVSLVFGGLNADQVQLAETITAEHAVTNTFGMPVPYSFISDENDWRTIYARLLRTNDSAQSPYMTASIILDTQPPTLSITSPTNGHITDRAWISLEGLTADSAGLPVVYVNSTRSDRQTGNQFIQEQMQLSAGPNIITVEAVDPAGNSITQQVTIVQNTSGDTTPPSITLDLPLDFTVTGDVTNVLPHTTVGSIDVLRLSGSTDDETAVVECYAIHPLGTNGPFIATLFGTQFVGEVMLGYGSNTLLTTATDAAGNQTVLTNLVLADYAFTFEITNPAPDQIISATQMVVSGRASLSFTNAALSVNGVSASVTSITNGGVEFSTDGPVNLTGGASALHAQALLDGQSYTYQASAFRYEYLSWHRDYSNDYRSQYWNTYGDRFTVNGWWNRDDSWHAHTRDFVAHRMQDVTYCDYIMGGQDCNTDIRNETTTTAGSPPVNYGYFGTENLRYDYTVTGGKLAWEHDTIRINDELTFVRHAPPEYANGPVCLQFEGMSYLRPSGTGVVASQITYNGRSGFMCNGNVSFLVNVMPNTTNTISEANFTWPAFQYTGTRKDRREWYEADTVTKAHLLSFTSFHSDPVRMFFKQTAEPAYGYGSYNVPSVKEIQVGQTKMYLGFSFPQGTTRDENSWVAAIQPRIPGEARLYVQRGGITNALAWSGSPRALNFVDGQLDYPVRMLQGTGASPVASDNNGAVEISNLEPRDTVVVEHVETGVRAEILVVDNFDWQDAQAVGLNNLTVVPGLAGLNTLITSNVLNTIKYALDPNPGSQQAQDRANMALVYAPLATAAIPSSMGIGGFAPDLFHLHVCFTGSIPSSAQQLKDDYIAVESAHRQGLFGGSEQFSIKAVRDSIAKLCELSQPALVTMLNGLATEPGIVFLYHSYEWVDDGYGGTDPELQPNDPIRNLLTNLSAADTAFYGPVNDPNLIYPGDTSNDAYTNFNITELITLKFYMNESGQLQLYTAPQGAYYGSIAAMQLHDLLRE